MGTTLGSYENRSAVPEPGRGTSGATHVRGLSELSYAIITGEKRDQLDSPAANKTTVIVSGEGALFLVMNYMVIGNANGKLLYVVFNASADGDANSKLATPGQRYVIQIDGWREWAFESRERLTRIDFASDAAAESNGTLVTWEYGLL